MLAHEAVTERQPLCNGESASSGEVAKDQGVKNGAGDGGRTRDLQLGKLTLYH
jgi:hypothetical protein